MMKRIAGLVLAFLLIAASSCAQELPDEAFDYWYEEMTCLVDEIGTRLVGTAGEKAGYDYLVETFGELGYSFENGDLFTSSCLVEDFSEDESLSLIAVREALNPDPQIITVCAHYDSVAPGARDNASGLAAMLTMCKLFTEQAPLPDTELRFIAFSAEETGHQGSIGYCSELTEDEIARSLAAFNIDILVAAVWEENRAFSMDTMGMRTPDGYVFGTDENPAYNRPALALLAAKDELDVFPDEDEDWNWCLPRTMGMSDHQSFHDAEIDSVNVCFRGNSEGGGSWPDVMHTCDDIMGDFDLDFSWNALNVLYTAINGLANNHNYGL